MTPTYEFHQKLNQGEQGERELDQFFSEQFAIAPVTPGQQRQGIDRLWRCCESGRVYSVEYKTDARAVRSGNCFIETVSADQFPLPRKEGWVYSSVAELLVYYLPQTRIWVVRMVALRAELPRWELCYESRVIPNRGYKTHGLIVPLVDLTQIAEEVLQYR